MVDSINTVPSTNSLLRAQQVNATQNLKSNQQLSQTIVNQLQKTSVVPVKASAVGQGSKLAGSTANLPRGSLVDVLT